MVSLELYKEGDVLALDFEDAIHGNDVTLLINPDGSCYQRTWTDAEKLDDMQEVLAPVDLVEKLGEILRYVDETYR